MQDTAIILTSVTKSCNMNSYAGYGNHTQLVNKVLQHELLCRILHEDKVFFTCIHLVNKMLQHEPLSMRMNISCTCSYLFSASLQHQFLHKCMQRMCGMEVCYYEHFWCLAVFDEFPDSPQTAVVRSVCDVERNLVPTCTRVISRLVKSKRQNKQC